MKYVYLFFLLYIILSSPLTAKEMPNKEVSSYGVLLIQLDVCAQELDGYEADFITGVSDNLKENIIKRGYKNELDRVLENPDLQAYVSNHTIETCTKILNRIKNPSI
jgi:hypothetical protein